MTNVRSLVSAAFSQASMHHQETINVWIKISAIVGGELLPDSELVASMQRIGFIDVLLRCMKQETAAGILQQQLTADVDLCFHYQVMLSEIWICESYEVFRLLIARKLLSKNHTFETLAHDLKLLRIPIAKHEIANDTKLSKLLQMHKLSIKGEVTDYYEYSPSDPRKAHIMGRGLSDRCSVMWDAIDCASDDPRWLERLSLSERIISFLQSDSQDLQIIAAKGN